MTQEHEANSHHEGGELTDPAPGSPDAWTRSVGDTAAPLLAGFSITVVIVVSDDARNFRWPGWAILALTAAAITLIAALQSSKYAREDRWPGVDRPAGAPLWTRARYFSLPPPERTRFWVKWTRRFYHLGLSALLAGLAFTLAPPEAAGAQDGFRWAASALAFAACAVETFIFMTAGREYTPAAGQAGPVRQSAASDQADSALHEPQTSNGHDHQ